MHGARHRLLASAAVVLTVGALTVTSASVASARTATPGASGVGDVLFPNLGNGGYDAQHYDLALNYPGGNPEAAVGGTVRMTADATQNLSAFDLDFAGDSVATVSVNGQPAKFSYQKQDEELVITPAAALPSGRTFTVDVAFTSHPAVPAEDDVYALGWIATEHGSYTAFQADRAHDAIPSNDHPSDKATWSFSLNVPSGTTAVANGVPVGKQVKGDRTVWTYREQNPLATELMQLAVGTDLEIVDRGSTNCVKLRDVISRDQRALVETAAANAAAQTRWIISKVGKFPFSVYGNLYPDAVFGFSLETQGMTLHSPALFNPDVIPGHTGNPEFYEPIVVHEDAHQWYGDSVSPSMWSDIWLNEGPTTYWMMVYADEMGYMKTWGYPSLIEYMRDMYSMGDAMRAQYGPIASPRPEDDLMSNGIIYDGAAVALYALQQKVGDRKFFEIMRDWPQTFKNQSKSTADFIAFASRKSGQDLKEFLTAWLYSEKTPPMPGHPDWSVTPPGAAAVATRSAVDTGVYGRVHARV